MTAADGVNVAYQVVGDGPVDLIVAQSHVWQCEVGWEHPDAAACYAALSQRYRLLLFDKRGQGLSDRVTYTDLASRALDVTAVLDAVGSTCAVLLGNSDGAPIVAAASLGDPRVIGLVLTGTSLAPFGPDRPWGPTPEQYRRFLDRAAAQWGSGMTLEYVAPGHADDPASVEWFGRLERAASGPGDVQHLIEFNLYLDWADEARAVTVPALVLRRDDELTTRAASREVVEAIPDARWANLPGDSHLWYLGDHRPLVAEIDAFVADCLARRRVA